MILGLLLAGNAIAAPYQQHFANEASFETLEEAHANGPAALSALTGRDYMPDPALDSYPAGTTYVYRSAGIYTDLSAAFRMKGICGQSRSTGLSAVSWPHGYRG